MLRRLTSLLFLAAIAAGAAHAQSTNVSGTIVDPNGVPYSFARISMQLRPPGISSPTCGTSGGGISDQSVNANAAGMFNVALCPNASIVPGGSGTQWSFTVNETGVPPPLGTGPQTFTVTLTISGSSQDISASLNAAAPALSSGGGGTLTGGGTAGTVAEWTGPNALGNSAMTETPTAIIVNNKSLTVQGSGSPPYGVDFVEGAPANCAIPQTGHVFLCAINSPDSLTESVNGGAFGPIGGVSGLTPNKVPVAATSTTLNDSHITDNGSTVDVTLPFTLNGQPLAPAPITVTPIAGQVLTGYDQPSGTFTQTPFVPTQLCAVQAGLSDTLDATVITTTETLFATVCKIPANTLVTGFVIDGQLGLDWTATATVPNSTFRVYLCPTQGSLVGCHGIYTGIQSAALAGTGLSSTLPIIIIGRQAAGAAQAISQEIAVGSSANSPFGRNGLSGNVSNIATNADLFIQFSVAFSAGTAGNTYTIRSLMFRK